MSVLQHETFWCLCATAISNQAVTQTPFTVTSTADSGPKSRHSPVHFSPIPYSGHLCSDNPCYAYASKPGWKWGKRSAGMEP